MKGSPLLTKNIRCINSTEEAVDILLGNSDMAFNIFNEMHKRINRLERRSAVLMLVSSVAVGVAAKAWGSVDGIENRLTELEAQLKEANDEGHFYTEG